MSAEPAPVRLDRRPDKIGRYRILDRLGKGAMGVVYAARDDLMDREVALKVLMADLEGDPEIRARFYREAQVAARLVHPNVVTIFDAGEDDGRLYIVMEILRGTTLGEYLKRPHIGIEDKLDVVKQVCEGLSVAADLGVCHRDIKPGNLFIQEDGCVKILDFGIARLASSSMTASGLIVGTPDYMSPEQARGDTVDHRSDQFSVGAVLYYMLSGRKPFAAPTLPAVLHKVVSENPPPLSLHDAPPELAQIVMRALAKDQVNRYETFRDLSADMNRFRRMYDTETQSLVTAARTRVETVRKLIDEEATLADALAVTSRPALDTAVAGLARDVPAVLERGAAVINTNPLRRGPVQETMALVERGAAPLEHWVRGTREARTQHELASRALQTGDVRSALASIEDAYRKVPDSPLLARDVEQCRAVAGERVVQAGRRAALLAQAAEERRQGRLQSALDCATEVLALLPGDPEAIRWSAELRQEIARDAAERRQRAQKQVDAARKALLKERFADVEDALRRARDVNPSHPEIQQVETQAAAALAARQAVDAALGRITARIGVARAVFEGGDRASGMSQIEALSAEFPTAQVVTRELERMRQEADRFARMEAAGLAADAATAQAESAWAEGDAVSAQRYAETALGHVPSHERALRVAGLARASIREAAERQARMARAAETVARARAYVQNGRLDRALKEAREALELDPAAPEAAQIVAESLRGLEAARVAGQERERAEKRARSVRPLLAEARAALRAGHLARAREAAQEALALDPENAEVRDLVASVAAAAALQAGGVDDEDTVEIVAGASDPDDTASMRRDGTAREWVERSRRGIQEAAARTRDVASELFAKLRSAARGRGGRS